MIYAAVIGLVIGAVAKWLVPGRDPGGLIVTALIGIGGSLFAHFIGSSMGYYQDGEPADFLAAVLGSMVLLLGYRAITYRKST